MQYYVLDAKIHANGHRQLKYRFVPQKGEAGYILTQIYFK